MEQAAQDLRAGLMGAPVSWSMVTMPTRRWPRLWPVRPRSGLPGGGVNEELRAMRAALEALQARYGRLTGGGLAPLDAADADREAAQVRALGRWFARHGTTPVDDVLDAEIVQD
ncbi:hypothetical protein ACIRRH_39690 [Kitasatospora sp. NPDC101235]|uniref:hypothetical protein n=1 Tax=Kitasatospora sp. NPDC101235 TaxID=3364101 RepID=UPI0038070779